MRKINRNDPCPCGSGKKFKKCHMGREEELFREGPGGMSVEEMGGRICDLTPVSYGRCREIVDALDIGELTGKEAGVRFVDLGAYAGLNISGSIRDRASGARGGGVFINPYKTRKADPDHLYVAVSPDIDDSTLIHELAHVLDYLGGSGQIPGIQEPLSFELGIPGEHLDHPEEFGYWMDVLRGRFVVQLDADDTVIRHLYEKGLLIKGKDIQERNGFVLKSKSDRILKYLSENSKEVDALIRDLPGYIGSRKAGE
ncbi:MAG: SEC-C domain-containing protein [Deltaproteobacteria bacterium]|nr:SEC-C domain-containing protein [Deltaproteobacteria bacterium]